ncbi:MAG: hypothetical protein UX99_C0022G0010 [Candidatus Amesbacteria bacterium GW2011_GWB1_47_26]|nr:MAG: hypothetical protein UX99_C0022G0010 [Candidatus Amesbacteria bacterium GW2011_GWB1_47_26]
MVGKRKANLKGVLRYINDNLEILFPQTRRALIRLKYANLPDWEDYLPSTVYLAADKLERQGLVEKVSAPEGMVVKITVKGRQQILKYDLAKMSPPKTKWDGKMQESVFVSPFNVFDQVRYVREVLEIPNRVKLAESFWVENQDELRQIFGV